MASTAKAKALSLKEVETARLRLAAIGFFFTLLLAIFFNAGVARADVFPQCDDAKVENRIIKDFNWAEKNTWQRGFELSGLTKMHEHRTTRFEGSIVTRRYCMGQAHLSNGKHRSIYYMINDQGGYAGLTWKVTHCVSGLDPWKNHDGRCRTMR